MKFLSTGTSLALGVNAEVGTATVEAGLVIESPPESSAYLLSSRFLFRESRYSAPARHDPGPASPSRAARDAGGFAQADAGLGRRAGKASDARRRRARAERAREGE